ncbi:MAG: hypothetical protein ABI678_20740, partial [Kofleriaceae bacterium]
MAACANDPQYVQCGTSDTMDVCTIDSTVDQMGSGDDAYVRGSLHVPIKPETATLTKARMDLQATMPAGVDVPLDRLDQYDISVEYTV